MKIFPPRTISSSTAASPVQSLGEPAHPPLPSFHPFANDLNLSAEELQEKDDPMRYIYNVRLIEEGAPEGVATDYANGNGHSEDGEKWEGSLMEVQADKIS